MQNAFEHIGASVRVIISRQNYAKLIANKSSREEWQNHKTTTYLYTPQLADIGPWFLRNFFVLSFVCMLVCLYAASRKDGRSLLDVRVLTRPRPNQTWNSSRAREHSLWKICLRLWNSLNSRCGSQFL